MKIVSCTEKIYPDFHSEWMKILSETRRGVASVSVPGDGGVPNERGTASHSHSYSSGHMMFVTSHLRRCNVMMLIWRCKTACARWLSQRAISIYSIRCLYLSYSCINKTPHLSRAKRDTGSVDHDILLLWDSFVQFLNIKYDHTYTVCYRKPPPISRAPLRSSCIYSVIENLRI